MLRIVNLANHAVGGHRDMGARLNGVARVRSGGIPQACEGEHLLIVDVDVERHLGLPIGLDLPLIESGICPKLECSLSLMSTVGAAKNLIIRPLPSGCHEGWCSDRPVHYSTARVGLNGAGARSH